MAAKILPSQTYLRECFDYDPETGVLTWRVRPRHHFNTNRGWNSSNHTFAGKTAGSLQVNGVLLCLNHQHYLAHRAIWKLVTGQDPPNEIDHKNRKRNDNRWNNLRLATRSQNQANTKTKNRWGLKGVQKQRSGFTFSAIIRHQGRNIYLGNFPTPEQAHAAYCEAAKKLHGDFWHSG